MKVIIIKEPHKLRTYFNGICKVKLDDSIRFYKNGQIHSDTMPSVLFSFAKIWHYKGEFFGFDKHFTIKTWKKHVEAIKLKEKELKRQKKLQIFI